MEYYIVNGELYHHGTKGMKWGVRLYQHKDGSLTPLGKARYRTDKGFKSKIDKQNAAAKARAAKAEKQSAAEKKAALLKSTDAKELYENRHLLTTAELNERINRIDTEARLGSKVVEEKTKTGREIVNEKMKNTTETLNNAVNLFKKVDEGYSAVANSTIGKTLAKQLGLEPPKKAFDLDDFWKNRNTKTTQEIMDVNKRLTAESMIKKTMDAAKAEADAAENLKKAQKQVDDYIRNGAKDDKVKSSEYSKTKDEIIDNKTVIDDGNWREVGKEQREAGKELVTYLLEDKLKHSDEELYHHGVKGQKWGVRRYQNEDGSLTSAGKKRLSDYKQKELSLNKAKYNTAKDTKRIDKLREKQNNADASGNVKRAEKIHQKIQTSKQTVKYKKAMRLLEKQKIKNMTYDEMMSEKHAIARKTGQALVESALLSAAGTAVILPYTGRIYVHVKTINQNAIKTNMRISNEEREKIAKRIGS
jgi:hypothetical protein